MNSSDPVYDAKLAELYAYLPGLRFFIQEEKRTHPVNKARYEQLLKVEQLMDMVMCDKKIKYENLLKCEALFKKLFSKKNAGTPQPQIGPPDQQANASTSSTDGTKEKPVEEIIGPDSPPPQHTGDNNGGSPIVIPTERKDSPLPVEKSSEKKSHHHHNHQRRHGSHDRQSKSDHKFHNDFKDVDYRQERRSSSKEKRRDTRPSHHDQDRGHFARRESSPRDGQDRSDRNERKRDDRDVFSRRQKNDNYGHRSKSGDRDRYDSCKDRKRSFELTDGNTSARSKNYQNYEPVAVIDLISDSPPQSAVHDYDMRNPNSSVPFCIAKDDKRVFSRLGSKVSDDRHFENFEINISNDLPSAMGNRKSLKPEMPEPLPTAIEAKTTAAVLEIPPLSSIDVRRLQRELSSDNSGSNSPDLTEIAQRRAPKIKDAKKFDTPKTQLEEALKKLKMVSEKITVNPSSNTQNILNTKTIDVIDSSPNAQPNHGPLTTGALNPGLNLTDKNVSNVNLMPCVNTQDPRLRKGSYLQTAMPKAAKVMSAAPGPVPKLGPSFLTKDPLLPLPQASVFTQLHVSPEQLSPNVSGYPVRNADPRLSKPAPYPASANQTNKNRPQQASALGSPSEENWDLNDDEVPAAPMPKPWMDKSKTRWNKETPFQASDAAPNSTWSGNGPANWNSGNGHSMPTGPTNAAGPWSISTVQSVPQTNGDAIRQPNKNPLWFNKFPPVATVVRPGQNLRQPLLPTPTPQPLTAITVCPPQNPPWRNVAPVSKPTTHYPRVDPPHSKKPPPNTFKPGKPKDNDLHRHKLGGYHNFKVGGYQKTKPPAADVPRTYAEFRQAKAAARTDVPAASSSTTSSSSFKDKDQGKRPDIDKSISKSISEETIRKSQTNENSTKKKDRKDEHNKKDESANKSTNATVNAPAPPPSLPAKESTLDKMYRSSNFSHTQFPKVSTTFKIPKKPAPKDNKKSTQIETGKKVGDKSNSNDDVNKNKDKGNKDSNHSSKPAKDIASVAEESDIQKKLEKKNRTDKKKDKESSRSDTPAKNVEETVEAPTTFHEEEPVVITPPSTNNKNDEITDCNRQEEGGRSSPAKQQIQEKSSKLSELLNMPSKPQRIMKRRSTMFAIRSAPIVGDVNFNSSTAIVYEDLRLRPEQSGIGDQDKNTEKSMNRKRFNDDGRVTVENIIYGKRRSNTNINFNETLQFQAVFKHTKPYERLSNEKVRRMSKSENEPSSQCADETATADADKTKLEENKESETNDTIVERNSESGNEKCDTVTDTVTGSSTPPPSVEQNPKAHSPNVLELIQKYLQPGCPVDEVVEVLRPIIKNDQKIEEVKELLMMNIQNQNSDNAQETKTETKDEKSIDQSVEASAPKEEITPPPNELGEAVKISPNKIVKRKPRRTELDKLNDDIREMFISEEVLFATDKRKCTEKPKINSPKLPIRKENNNNNTAKIESDDESVIDVVDTVPSRANVKKDNRVRQLKVMVKSMNMEKYFKERRKANRDKNARGKSGGVEKGTKKSKSCQNYLKLNMKPCPKYKKHSSYFETSESSSSDDTDDSSYVKPLSIVASGSASTKLQRINATKNINPNWHCRSQTKMCSLCDMKGDSIHYKWKHTEFYYSRLPPNTLAQLKRGELSKTLYCLISASKKKIYLHKCQFCQIYSRKLMFDWVNHFGTHTGEFRYECSYCQYPSNVLNKVKHTQEECPNSVVVYNAYPTSMGSGILLAYVCHLCNFVQLIRENIDEHYINHHNMKKGSTASFGYTVDLMNLNGAKTVDFDEGVKIHEKLKALNTPIIDIDDDAMDVDEKESSESVDAIAEQTTDNAVNPNDNKDNGRSSDSNSNSNSNSNEQMQEDVVNVASQADAASKDLDDEPKSNDIDAENATVDGNAEKSKSLDQNDELQNDVLELAAQAEAAASSSATVAATDTDESPTSNVFKPTRDFNVSPNSIDNLVKNMFDTETCSDIPCWMGSDGKAKDKDAISMTDRLSKCINDFKQLSNSRGTNETSESVQFAKPIVELSQENSSVSTVDFSKEPNENTEDSADEDWEDIEITESAPNATSSRMASKDSINRRKRNYKKFKHFYNSIIPTTTKGKYKHKEMMKSNVNDKQKNVENSNSNSCSSHTNEMPSKSDANNPEPEPETKSNNSRFLPNLDELLPDSPCNDPFDLVPELTPCEPLQDLNDLSSILDSNLSEANVIQTTEVDTTAITQPIAINEDTQQTSIQEALEFVAEQQKIESLQSTGKRMNRIQNMGYSVSSEKNDVKYYCLIEGCTFLYSNESIGLESHFVIEHGTSKWNGYCNICKQQVGGGMIVVGNGLFEFPLAQEMKHMLEKHLNPREAPRLKLRRLSGDCLSTIRSPECNSPKNPFLNENASLRDLLQAEQRSLTMRPPLQSGSGIDKELAAAAATHSTDEVLTLFDENTNFNNLLTAKSKPPTILTSVENYQMCEPHIRNFNREISIESVQSLHETAAGKCPLQIANVVSLGEQFERNRDGSATVPKISGYCSLNGQSNNMQSIQSQHHVTVERNDNAAPAITATAGNGSIDRTNSSDEVVVVAETMPIAQTTTGNFMITQTVTAQYDDNRTGGDNQAMAQFNISIANSSTETTLSTAPIWKRNTEPNRIRTYSRQQFKCMGAGCKFQTCVPSNMRDHLEFHYRHNFSTQKEFLRCSICSHMPDNGNDYMLHIEQEHIKKRSEQMSTTDALTQQIKDIFRETYNPSANTTETPKKTYKEKLEEAIKDIVKGTGVPDKKLFRCVVDKCNSMLCEQTFHTHVEYHLSTLGRTKDMSYKCRHCPAKYSTVADIKSHLKSHAEHSYFCYVCMTTAANPQQMSKHYMTEHRKQTIEFHWSELHKTTNTAASSGDCVNIYFVAHEKRLSADEVQEFGEKLVLEWERKKALSRTHFYPHESDLLPPLEILQTEIFCAQCPYKTKVRMNMQRHMTQHKEFDSSDMNANGQILFGNVDPVNPVPCLNSNERHFDKMTNLASSSLVPQSKLTSNATKIKYVYVPEIKRFTCTFNNCPFATEDEQTFHTHLDSSHADQQANMNKCPFCSELIGKRGTIGDRVVLHLRYHGSFLYQCSECGYVHPLRSSVMDHINEKHPASCVTLTTYKRTIDGSLEGVTQTQTVYGKRYKDHVIPAAATLPGTYGPAATASVSSKSSVSSELSSMGGSGSKRTIKRKWLCMICKHGTSSQQEIMRHCQKEHNCRNALKCSECEFSTTQENRIQNHILTCHSNVYATPAEIIEVYRKLPSAVTMELAPEIDENTRPLWQRNDPNRVRHIRGILMEDEEESERYQLALRENEEDEEEEENEEKSSDTDGTGINPIEDSIVPTTAASPELGSFEFCCYYCSYQSVNFNDLKLHWRNDHFTGQNLARPFLYRVATLLKCTKCDQVVKGYNEMETHSYKCRTKINLATDPNVSSTSNNLIACGYCRVMVESKHKLRAHHVKVNHQKYDVKNLVKSLDTLLAMGSREVVLHCTLCTQIFACRDAIVNHAKERHDGDVFSFKNVTGKILYGCPTCNYLADDELICLRHMGEHCPRFQFCAICNEHLSDFNSSMNHFYTKHHDLNYRDVFSFKEFRKHFSRLMVIFPNGLVTDKVNLTTDVAEGGIKKLQEFYNEVCKTAEQPPIPTLSIGRLVAQQQPTSNRITKRRSTVAFDLDSPRYIINKKPKEKTNSHVVVPSIGKLSDSGHGHGQKVVGPLKIIKLPLEQLRNESSTQGIPSKISKRRTTVAYDLVGGVSKKPKLSEGQSELVVVPSTSSTPATEPRTAGISSALGGCNQELRVEPLKIRRISICEREPQAVPRKQNAMPAKISKRRSTVAFGLEPPQRVEPIKIMKRPLVRFEVEDESEGNNPKKAKTDNHQRSTNNNDRNNLCLSLCSPSKKISKRRATVAVRPVDLYFRRETETINHEPLPQRQRRMSVDVRGQSDTDAQHSAQTMADGDRETMEPFSFYGQRPEIVDWKSIYTTIAVNTSITRIPIENLKHIFNFNSRLDVKRIDTAAQGEQQQQLDVTSASQSDPTTADTDTNDCVRSSEDTYLRYKNVKKACPASLKHLFAPK